MAGMRELSKASLHFSILKHFVDHGHAPTRATLVEMFDASPAAVVEALRVLADDHGVVLHPHEPEIWVIHPFSTAPTPFIVRFQERNWWGNCAWCSLGIAAILGGHHVTIQTTLGAEGRPITIHIDDHRVREDLLVHFPIPMTRAWDNVIFTCSTMLVFGDEPSIDLWSAQHALPRGDAQPIQKIYAFARVWYGRHLDLTWRKWSAAEAHDIFQQFGLSGPIWDLPQTKDRF